MRREPHFGDDDFEDFSEIASEPTERVLGGHRDMAGLPANTMPGGWTTRGNTAYTVNFSDSPTQSTYTTASAVSQ